MIQPEVYIESIGEKAYVKEKRTKKTLGYWENKKFVPLNNEIIDVEYKIIEEPKEEKKDEIQPS
jgi:hypothetical protein